MIRQALFPLLLLCCTALQSCGDDSTSANNTNIDTDTTMSATIGITSWKANHMTGNTNLGLLTVSGEIVHLPIMQVDSSLTIQVRNPRVGRFEIDSAGVTTGSYLSFTSGSQQAPKAYMSTSGYIEISQLTADRVIGTFEATMLDSPPHGGMSDGSEIVIKRGHFNVKGKY